jgi:hypothetical protein
MSALMAAVTLDPQPGGGGLRLSVPTRLLSAVALMVAVTACNSAGEEPAGLAPVDRSPASASAEPTAATTADEPTTSGATSTPTPGELPPGLVFEDIPPASGNAAAALHAYLGLEAEIWRSFLAAKLSPDLPEYATEPVVADWQAAVKYQQDHDQIGGGSIVITPTIDRVSENLVLIGGCADMSELTNIVDGKETPPPEVLENPTWAIEAIVMVDQASGGRWKVSEYRQEPGQC